MPSSSGNCVTSAVGPSVNSISELLVYLCFLENRARQETRMNNLTWQFKLFYLYYTYQQIMVWFHCLLIHYNKCSEF